LLKRGGFQEKKKKTPHFFLPKVFFPPPPPPEYRAVYETPWKNMVDANWLQMTGQRARFACCVRKATDTHLEFVIPIAFLLQQGLLECT